jgi:(1->4)-alpha-D-glucan 1-alpha-D-glucosylmutase
MCATYRLQLTPQFGFDAARELVPYLCELGVSHVYLSPIMAARAGSTHGYDVVDPGSVSEQLGGEDRFRRLARAVLEADMRLLVDFVPNHMAIDDANPYWRDQTRRCTFFDIDPESGWHRRFFTIDDLAGVRVEDPEVFRQTHAKVLSLVADGLIDGLRIDHVDGLADPAGYLARLRGAGVERIWVEKILEPGEQLREWPVEGTTGYEFAGDVTALFVDPAGEPALTELYEHFTGERESYPAARDAAKREQAACEFVPELDRLRSLYPHPQLADAIASLPVYRTYVQPYERRVAEADRRVLAGLPEDLRRVLLLEQPDHDEFVVRFQQTTGAVMAKGVEDTVFYRYLRLVALNEVGGDPERFSLSVDAFHEANRIRLERFPRNLLTSQTHDTKRSGDVRARIGALAEMALDWTALVHRWHELTASLRRGPGPDAAEEYLIYQTLAGTWPIEPQRLAAYLEKALREAGRNSSWSDPDAAWERSVIDFATALFSHGPFRSSFDPFAARVARAGERHALGALLLRMTCPGLPDIYQGDELESLNLVDPDNRRPVDWDERRRALAALRSGAPANPHMRKLAVIRETLALRARRPHAFAGSYTPIEAPPGICAFTRGAEVAVIVAVRADANPTAVSPPGRGWCDVLAPASWPVRLLERDPARPVRRPRGSRGTG